MEWGISVSGGLGSERQASHIVRQSRSLDLSITIARTKAIMLGNGPPMMRAPLDRFECPPRACACLGGGLSAYLSLSRACQGRIVDLTHYSIDSRKLKQAASRGPTSFVGWVVGVSYLEEVKKASNRPPPAAAAARMQQLASRRRPTLLHLLGRVSHEKGVEMGSVGWVYQSPVNLRLLERSACDLARADPEHPTTSPDTDNSSRWWPSWFRPSSASRWRTPRTSTRSWA